MELDRTEIVIRKRNSLELLDLSLLVVKRHFAKLALAGAIFGLPLMVLNLFLVGWMISEDSALAAENTVAPDAVVWWRFVSHLCILTTMQFPIASFPVTLLLGAQIFFLPISMKELFHHLRSLSGQVLSILGIVRLGFLGILVEMLIRWETQLGAWESIFLFFVFPVCLIFRTFWPFAPEIIGLERCPLMVKDSEQISYAKRRSNLHGPLQGDLLNRMLAAVFFGALLLVMTVGTILFVKAIITGDWGWNWFFSFIFLPLGLFVVGIFLAVFRYLSYIDSRIRLEGWEIELRLRAEAMRLKEHEQPSVALQSPAVSGASQ